MAYKDLLDLTFQQAIQYFERVEDSKIRPEVFRVIISRLNALRGISTDKITTRAGKAQWTFKHSECIQGNEKTITMFFR